MFSNNIIIFVLKDKMLVALYADFGKVYHCAASSVFVDTFRELEGHCPDSAPVITRGNLYRLIWYEVTEIYNDWLID